jgi:AcrR family transcriptional regulator
MFSVGEWAVLALLAAHAIAAPSKTFSPAKTRTSRLSSAGLTPVNASSALVSTPLTSGVDIRSARTRKLKEEDESKMADGLVSRPMILQAALRIIDRDGSDGLSMRRLSEEVGRDPTVLYRHVPSKAALLDGVAEIVLGQLRVDTSDPDWTGQLRAVAHEFRLLALAHPNVVPLLVTRPLATPLGQRPPGMLRSLEDVLALLTTAGFSGPDALHIYRVLFGYLQGHILNELQEVIERPDETDDVLRLGLHRLAVTEFPQVRALASVLASYDGAAELDRGLDLILVGLAATLTPPSGRAEA